MNHKDLRIGNLLYDQNNRVCRVESIGMAGQVRLTALDGGYEFESTTNYSPIPLTVEILLNSAFKKMPFSFFENSDAYYLPILSSFRLYPDQKGFLFSHENIHPYFFDLTIQHVHRLQNIYWNLCDYELELTIKP